MAGDGLQQDGAVLDGPGHRAGGVVGERVGHHARAADQPIGWLQPDQPAQPSRVADRAAGVRAERPHHQPRRHPGARAAGRAAGEVLAVPRISRRRPGQVERRPAMGEFMRRQLAQQHRAGFIKPGHGCSVEFWHVGLASAGMPGRADAGGAVDVLQRDRNAMQWAAVAAGHDFRLRRPGLLQRQFGGHQQIGVQLRIDRLDAVEECPGQLHRRKLPPLEQLGGLGDRHEMQLGGGVGSVVGHREVLSGSEIHVARSMPSAPRSSFTASWKCRRAGGLHPEQMIEKYSFTRRNSVQD